MRELIDLLLALLSQPLFVILLAVWLLSGLGRLGQKAARRAVEQQAARRRAEQAAQAPTARPQPKTAAPRGRPAPRRPTSEEIAAEIRRMMGLEEPAAPPPRAPERETPRPVTLVRPVVVEVESPPRPPLAPAVAPASIVPVMPAVAAARRRRRRRLLDLSNPAAAIVAMEVLGPPRALRGLEP